jgi:Osmosensitive K+ channel histidine kinase
VSTRIRTVRQFVASTAAIALLTALYARLHIVNTTIVALTFLLVVVIVAAMSTRWVALATSVAAFMAFNFFFLPPVGSLAVAGAENLVTLFTLLAVSVVASHLSTEARRRAQEATAAEVARRSAELKSSLLASLGHDLKTPLTAVMVAANNLNAPSLTEEQRREQAAIVRAELERLNRLFQDMADMARIETNAIAVEPEWVQPAEIVEAALAQVQPTLAQHRIDLDVADDHTLVRLDPRLTSAALAHILENAAQYSEPGSVILVGAALSHDELRFTVRDHGSGISQQDLPRLFERSYRGASAQRARPGTGMGLSISQGLLNAEGGRVWANNHADGGAIFTVAVPIESRPAPVLEPETT